MVSWQNIQRSALVSRGQSCRAQSFKILGPSDRTRNSGADSGPLQTSLCELAHTSCSPFCTPHCYLTFESSLDRPALYAARADPG